MLPFAFTGALDPHFRRHLWCCAAATTLRAALEERHLALQIVLDCRPEERRCALLLLNEMQRDLGEAQAEFLDAVREYHRQNWTLVGLLDPLTQSSDAAQVLRSFEAEWSRERGALGEISEITTRFQAVFPERIDPAPHFF